MVVKPELPLSNIQNINAKYKKNYECNLENKKAFLNITYLSHFLV